MKKGSYKLNEFHIGSTHNDKVNLVEIYENLATGSVYSRVYVRQTQSQIPTICFGPLEDVGKIGYRDNIQVFPYKGLDEIKTDSDSLVFSDIRRLPGLEQIFETAQRLFYVVRPSTFLLTSVWNSTPTLDDPIKRIKVFDNLLLDEDREEFFAHITSPDEARDLFPDAGLYGLAFTNSPNYANLHSELNWL